MLDIQIALTAFLVALTFFVLLKLQPVTYDTLNFVKRLALISLVAILTAVIAAITAVWRHL